MNKRTLIVSVLASALSLSAGFAFAANQQDDRQVQQERKEYNAKMRAAKNDQERNQIRNEHHDFMQKGPNTNGLASVNIPDTTLITTRKLSLYDNPSRRTCRIIGQLEEETQVKVIRAFPINHHSLDWTFLKLKFLSNTKNISSPTGEYWVRYPELIEPRNEKISVENFEVAILNLYEQLPGGLRGEIKMYPYPKHNEPWLGKVKTHVFLVSGNFDINRREFDEGLSDRLGNAPPKVVQRNFFISPDEKSNIKYILFGAEKFALNSFDKKQTVKLTASATEIIDRLKNKDLVFNSRDVARIDGWFVIMLK